MKIRFLVFVLLLPFLAAAQLPVKLKYDTLIYSADSATVLVVSGKTNAVWDLRHDRYAIEPTKNKLVNFPHSNQYAEIDRKTSHLTIHISEERFTAQATGDANECYVSIQDASTYPVLDCNGKLQGTLENVRLPDTLVAGTFDWSQFRISKISESIYTITSYAQGYMLHKIDDSWEYVPGFYGSGIYRLSDNSWLIEPVYKELFIANNWIFGVRSSNQSDSNFVYDVWKYDGTKITLQLQNVSSISDEALRIFFDADQIARCGKTTYFISTKNGINRIHQLQLYSPADSLKPEFILQANLAGPLALALYEPTYTKLAVVTADSIPEVRMYHLDTLTYKMTLLAEDTWKVQYSYSSDPKAPRYLLTSLDTFQLLQDSVAALKLVTPNVTTTIGFVTAGFGFEKINDSLISVLNYFPGGKLKAFKSVVYPDEDSITSDGMIIYYHEQDRTLKSGVFNLKSRSWLLEPIHQCVFVGDKRYIGHNPDDLFSMYDEYGSLIADGITESEVYRNPKYLMYFTPYLHVTEAFEAPKGFWHHRMIKDTVKSYYSNFHESSPIYYVRSEGKLGLYKPDYGFVNTTSSVAYEFVHYNPSLDAIIYLKSDSMYLESPSGFFSAPVKNGKLIYRQTGLINSHGVNYQVVAVSGNDTIFYGKPQKGDVLTTISIEVKNNLLIINDYTSKVSDACENCVYCPDCPDEYQGNYTHKLILVSENSSVWKKSAVGWIKISPYYATLHVMKNGQYIASTGSYFELYHEVPDFYGDRRRQEMKIDIPTRYFLLDSNFHAISFLDYFDFPDIQDLGFGIKIKLDNARYFFMTYDGKAITDADWDHFEIERGKLKAILYTTYVYDENGNVVLNEFGYPQEATNETVKYFTLQ